MRWAHVDEPSIGKDLERPSAARCGRRDDGDAILEIALDRRVQRGSRSGERAPVVMYSHATKMVTMPGSYTLLG